MRKPDSMKEAILINKLKAEDPIELPMDEIFFDNLHDKIMLSVEKTEIKPAGKWSKTWVFLEQKTVNQRARLKKGVKLSITIASLTAGISFVNHQLNQQNQDNYANLDSNKTSIISEAQRNPAEWSQLAVNYQNENDFYAEVLSQKSHETIVEIDNVIAQSL